MGHDLLVPTNKPHIESAGQNSPVQRDSLSGDPSLAHENLVRGNFQQVSFHGTTEVQNLAKHHARESPRPCLPAKPSFVDSRAALTNPVISAFKKIEEAVDPPSSQYNDHVPDKEAGQSAANVAGRLTEESVHLESYKVTEGAPNRLILISTDLSPNGAADGAAGGAADGVAGQAADRDPGQLTEAVTTAYRSTYRSTVKTNYKSPDFRTHQLMPCPTDDRAQLGLPLTPIDQTPSTSNDSRQHGSFTYEHLFSVMTSNNLSRTEFIKNCLVHNGLQASNVNYITSSVRPSTQKQYNHAWKVFCKFCKTSNSNLISDNLIISFFDFLLKDKNLRVNTLQAYKSALVDPLKYGFNYNIPNEIVLKCFKGMANLNPAVPIWVPDWSLDAVLQYLIDNKNNSSPLFLTRKTLFLVGLCLGSRISELFALRRDEKSLIRMNDGSLKIYPDITFLAKNENPLERRGPHIIKPLINGDDTLCPVKSLEIYLTATCTSSCNHLFVHPINFGKWNRAGLSLAMVRLIREAQPDSFPRAHDVRKISTSLAFMRNMKIADITNSTGWKSTKVFLKHYLINIQEFNHQCSSFN